MWRGRVLVVVGSGLCASSQGDDDLPAAATRQCEGNEEEFQLCPDLKPCAAACTPRNCEFRPWLDWVTDDGCSGLRTRQRDIGVTNNECGTPCRGSHVQTAVRLQAKCITAKADCEMSDWSEWSVCTSQTDQRYRKKHVLQKATAGGKGCDGPMKETEPCQEGCHCVKDCQFSQWSDWTGCSVSCGQGHMQRIRFVKQKVKNSGYPCEGATLETGSCKMDSCPSTDADIGAWSDWSQCDGEDLQRYRSRALHQKVTGDVKAFQGSLREVSPCELAEPKPCEFADWTSWTRCDRSCDGGQTRRKRRVTSAAEHGGHCDPHAPLEEIAACNTHSCHSKHDCALSQWEDWSDCDADCGTGTQMRKREVVREASEHARGCHAPLDEVRTCEVTESPSCGERVDCQWGDWHDWGGCSCDCGGGTKRRQRLVKKSPRNNGTACEPLDKSEIEPCNTQSCNDDCTDAEWAPWSDWSSCSASCGDGYKSRRRDVLNEANGCGKALEGLRTQYLHCVGHADCEEDRDCVVSDWSQWTSCSCECFGLKERNRFIMEFVSGNGKACNDVSLRVTAPCNPEHGDSPPHHCVPETDVDCQFGEWSDWGGCSRSCGGGQMERERVILTASMGGGLPCSGDLHRMAPCNEHNCVTEHCEDCQWSQWGDWSDCTHCGGQRFRHRHIAKRQNSCGKPCEEGTAEEVGNCTSHCEAGKTLTCGWSSWTDSRECPTDACGPVTKSRSRVLHQLRDRDDDGDVEPLFVAPKGSMCSGVAIAFDDCGLPSCTVCEPQDCVLSDWEDWGIPSCEGLCERKRAVQTSNNDCGQPCSGSLTQTKRCEPDCSKPVDCQWGDWGEWTPCSSKYGQKMRSRQLLHEARLGGASCEGAGNETEACYTPPVAEDCELSDWTPFGKCSTSCGGGLQQRHRMVIKPAVSPGKLCQGILEELVECNKEACHVDDVDCTLSDWGSWSNCDASSQRYRDREVSTEPSGNGKPCNGTLKEAETCPTRAVDCVMSEWAEWGACDKSCDAGQKERHRQIHKHPRNGGKACEEDIVQLAPCNTHNCGGSDCEVGDWAEWSDCDVLTCGEGQRKRSREVLKLRDGIGLGCEKVLEETAACEGTPCDEVVDCVMADWNAWSSCTCSCNGGQRVRDRNIKTMAGVGGKPCLTEDLEEVEPCNAHPCSVGACVDGKWGDWKDWSACSNSCGGGRSYRSRRVAKEANACGRAPEGANHEMGFCNVGVPCEAPLDCEFDQWTQWSDCTQTCDGLKRRSRGIKRYGRGKGAYCLGASKQTSQCNPSPGGDRPGGCGGEDPEDCKFVPWSDWSDCSASCGGGQESRFREVSHSSKRGGKPCDGPLSVVRQCNSDPCERPKAVDCELGDWEDWGACSKCGGEMERLRRLLQVGANGGKECQKSDLEEVAKCPLVCEHSAFCTWADWSDWGTCSAQCGRGRRGRRRRLTASLEDADDLSLRLQNTTAVEEALPTLSPGNHKGKRGDKIKRYEAIRVHTLFLEQSRFQGIALAFCGGMLTFIAALGVWRLLHGGRRPSWCGGRPEGVDDRYAYYPASRVEDGFSE
eukprot:TRINITY_DN4747_c0_g1_i1.p1 TRINITY_DN4747_c0_g1~~TRINITY_DN4747_c0_g1_i1.p1  ORF type:complete len:1556 (-),score=307.09 TRINITY_DN4747_c0_g1_i1:124-4791(-)